MINYTKSTKVKFKNLLFCNLEWPPVTCCTDVSHGIFREDYKGFCIGCPNSSLNMRKEFKSAMSVPNKNDIFFANEDVPLKRAVSI